ncbi:hypothetical protein [Sinimarinibacterium thermocellulolyticum]|uniref:Uncharacterized protein n=1 Tax=Sinimarinibacterium thermocellulolyticum TaxID=3170016 RepID=A0ABV2ACI4_9GAMM
MLNRSAVVVRYRQPFVDWINRCDPTGDGGMTLLEANEDPTVYLVEAESRQDFERWLRLNHEPIFEALLEDWYTDETLWPADRSIETLKLWCSFEFHSTVFDTGESPIEDDDEDED